MKTMSETVFNINVALIGSISSGKSTFLNALFSEHYAENKIKRTTMCPQIYTESNSSSEIDVFKINSQMNNELFGNIKTIDDLKEIRHNVNFINKIVTTPYRKNIKFSIHDLPGLNDVETKNIYYEYVKKNFHTFDIVIYVIDIKSALNTTDEADILNLVLEEINNNNKEYDIQTKLIILVNKCDNMDYKSNEIIIDTESVEYAELYRQVENVIQTRNKYDIEYKLFPISCENAFIHNLLCNAPNKLTETQMNKIGIDYFGKIYWNKLNEDNKRKRLIEFTKDKNNSEIVINTFKNTGFEQFKNYFNSLFLKKKAYVYILNKCKYNFYLNINFNLGFLNGFTKITKDDARLEMLGQIGNNLMRILQRLINFFELTKTIFSINDSKFKNSNTYLQTQNTLTQIMALYIHFIPFCEKYYQVELNIFMKFKRILLDLHKSTKYFDDELCSNFILENNLNLISSCRNEFQEKISHMKTYTDVFNPKEIIDILDVLVDYCDVKDVSEYVIILFSCESLYNGLKTELSSFNLVSSSIQHNLISSSIQHNFINSIVNFFEKKYHLTNSVMCSIRINIIINMYKYIIDENNRGTMYYSTYLHDNVGCLLFQMDKFWNGPEIYDLLKYDFKGKTQIQHIQYLASECRLITSQNKHYAFNAEYLKSNLELENCILNTLHSIQSI